MPLRRSDSAKTTLSVYNTRKTKYQKWLGMMNVLMLLGSLTMIFFGVCLLEVYFMDNLDHLSVYFVIMPWLLVAVGVGLFFISGFGFIFSANEHRKPLMVFASFLAVIALGQVASVFVAMECRSVISKDIIEVVSGPAFDADISEGRFSKWDRLQRRLRCCGANDYQDYLKENRIRPNSRCFPESCCTDLTGTCSTINCRGGPKTLNINEIWDKLYLQGCMTVLRQLYKSDLEPIILSYAVLSVLLAIIETVTIALSSAYVAQLTRRKKREWVPGEDVTNHPQNGNAMSDF